MKAEELRIGNCILFDGKIIYVSTRQMAYISNSNRLKNGDSIAFQPIPLTEEILLKCGFEKDDSGVEISDQDYCEWYQKEFPIIGVLCQSPDKSYIFDENTDTIRIVSLNQLQNLYFALTGNELKINF